MANVENSQFYTLVVAAMSAGFSLMGVALSIWNARSLPKREARRKILEDDINSIGGCLYYLIAISQKMADAKSDKAFDNFRKIGDGRRNELNVLRARLRYGLWGLDEGIRELRSVPFYISHYRNDRSHPRVDKMIRLATKLRIELDEAILGTYASGSPVGVWRRQRIRYRAWRLRSCFADGRSKSNRMA